MDSIFMKKGVLLFVIFRFLVSGVEEYIILPTAWLYIRSLGETEIYLGIMLASYGAIIVLFRPVLGKIVAKYRCPKLILLVCHALRMCGNALYSVMSSPHYALIGRLLCGIAAASDVILLGELGRTTKAKYRANVFRLLDGVYILGCGLGPFFATMFVFNFEIYAWQITRESSPGFTMAIAWLIIFLVTIILPCNFSEDESLSDRQLFLTPKDYQDQSDPQKNAVRKSQILCLLFYIFFIWFFACVNGYYTPLFATELFNLRQFHVNLLFGNALLFQTILFLLHHTASENVNERVLLLMTMFVQIIPLIILGIFGLRWTDNSSYLLLVYIVFGTPLFSITLACSLLTKITGPELTVYYQRLVYTSVHLAIVLGRLVPAFFFAKTLVAWLALQLGFLWIMITTAYTIVFFMKY